MNDETKAATKRKDQKTGHVFDLETRTTASAEAIVKFTLELPHDHPVLQPLIRQLVRSGTSIGANYCEANNASSPADFAHKISLCRKEARETMYWLRLLGKAWRPALPAARDLWRECRELQLIFSAIFRKSRQPRLPPPKPAD
jgi:four helix bundle protein